MDGQLILGIVVAVVALFGPMFWFGYRQGMMNGRLQAIEDGQKQMQHDLGLIKDSLFRRAQAELVSKGWAGFERGS